MFSNMLGAVPDYYYVKKEKRQIGFTLELTGTHEQGWNIRCPDASTAGRSGMH